jgi:hypothetical protein
MVSFSGLTMVQKTVLIASAIFVGIAMVCFQMFFYPLFVRKGIVREEVDQQKHFTAKLHPLCSRH